MKIRSCNKSPILSPCALDGLNYQIDPYIGCEHYCCYCYALNQAQTDWSKEIYLHENLTSQLDVELAGISPQRIYLGYQTDPYQPCEAEQQQTRQALELLLAKGFSASILTKSNLMMRDMDLLLEMKEASVSVSVAFNGDTTRQRFEANTIETEARIEVLMKMKNAGLASAALICPVIPYITDPIPLANMLAPYADKIWIYGLSVSDRNDKSWQHVSKILKKYYSDLTEEIEEVVFSPGHHYWTGVRQQLLELQRNRDLNLSIHL